VVAGAGLAAPVVTATPAGAAPVPSMATANAVAGEVSPLCQLEGGNAFAVDAGESKQFPNDPLAYPLLMGGDAVQITVIPCWTDDPTQTGNWITSATAYLGNDDTPLGEVNGLHTVDPFTLDLHPTSVPSTPSLEQLRIEATDNTGVERWSAGIAVEILTPCSDDTIVGIDTGTAHDGYYPQIKGDAAQITVIPCSLSDPTQTDTWITSVTAWVWGGPQVDDEHPVAEVTGLHATDAFTLDLHNYDGTVFVPGTLDFRFDVTDNHGVEQTVSRQIWVVNPISASWTVGTTEPDTPTTVRATLNNETGSPVRSVTFSLTNTALSDPAPASLAADLSYAESTMTFTAGPDRIFAFVTVANGTTYPLARYDVDARYTVDTNIAAPDNTEWGARTTFRAKAVNSAGVVQRGLTLHLQSRALGSTTWVQRALATTNARGAATLSVPAATTGTAAWRITSKETKIRHASTSPTHVVRVHAVFGRLPHRRSTQVGHTIRYSVVVRPANARARVDIQIQRIGHPGWSTLSHVTSQPTTTTIPVRLTHVGRYRIRLVVDRTTALARTISRSWSLQATR
jgi:hypothetical protein